jgi:hypothetical protein
MKRIIASIDQSTFFFLLAIAIACFTQWGCAGFETEGYACHGSSSSSGEDDLTTITPSPTTSTTQTSSSSETTSAPPDDTSTSAAEESSSDTTDGSSSSGDPGESSTGPDPQAHTHCGETCLSDDERESVDGTACVCAEDCGFDDECMTGETCNPIGVCTVLCTTADDCPDPGMVCAPWSKFYNVCMWSVEP